MRKRFIQTLAYSAVFAAATAVAAPVETLPTGTMLPKKTEWEFVDDPQPERVRTIMFAYVPPDYFGDNAAHFADIGIEGAMFGRIMKDWHVDIWRVPAFYAPEAEAPEGRIVGEENPVFQKCRRMNEQCREAGIGFNSVKTALRHPLPDWFDDTGWAELLENYRQLSIFARDAGFAGVTVDIEYINQIYHLDYEAWQVPDYPRDEMRAKARERGYQMLSIMLGEFPDMIHWHLPQSTVVYGPLATDLVVGMVSAMADRDAPGGFHMCTEDTYLATDPGRVLHHTSVADLSVVRALEQYADDATLRYWRERCTVSPGLWPLGVSRKIYDGMGVQLGHGGAYERFSDRLVGSRADKGSNYGVEEFRAQYAAARMASRRFVWIYGHNSIFWRMTPDEMRRYDGSMDRDAAPLDDEIDAYEDVIRADRIINDTFLRRWAGSIREGETPRIPGFAPAWWHAGPFPNGPGQFPTRYGPEEHTELDRSYDSHGEEADGTLRWKRANVEPDGYVNLIEEIGALDESTAYSLAWVECEEPTTTVFRVGTNDYGAVFVGGENVYMNVRQHPAVMDAESFVVHLPEGRTSILVKTGNTGGNWGFYLRITSPDGAPVPGMRWSVPEP